MFSIPESTKKGSDQKQTRTRIDVYETLCPNRCLYIKVAKLRTGLGSKEMSHLQNCSLKIYLKSTRGGGGGGGGGVPVGGVKM